MKRIIDVDVPAGTKKSIGVPAEEPADAIEAMKKLFHGIPNVVCARLGLMQLAYPNGHSIFSYTIGIECLANREAIEQQVFDVLKSTPAGRWPISVVPPTAEHFTSEALVFFQR